MRITVEECQRNAASLREKAEKQPWASVSHRRSASWWDEAAEHAAARGPLVTTITT